MLHSIQAQRISFGTLFKLLFIGNLIAPILLLIVLALLSSVGLEVLKVEGKYLTGLDGLLAGLVGVPVLAIVAFCWSVFFGVSYFISLWLYSRWRPIKLSYTPTHQHTRLS